MNLARTLPSQLGFAIFLEEASPTPHDSFHDTGAFGYPFEGDATLHLKQIHCQYFFKSI